MTRFIVSLDTRMAVDNPRLCFMPGNYVSYSLRLPGRVRKSNESRVQTLEAIGYLRLRTAE